MKVKLKTNYAGPKASYSVGAIIKVSDDEGKMLVKGGFAIALEKIKVEKAVRKPVETAKKGRKKKAKK